MSDLMTTPRIYQCAGERNLDVDRLSLKPRERSWNMSALEMGTRASPMTPAARGRAIHDSSKAMNCMYLRA